MKKIPTLFKREFEGHKVIKILPEVTPGFEWVLEGNGIATVKWDGACCAIINWKLYKRYDAKKGKTPPEGAIPCCDPDPVTGHWPHWIKCDPDNPADKWFFKAEDETGYINTQLVPYRTYEAIGKHFNGNPYGIEQDALVPHGNDEITDLDRSFDGIREYLRTHTIEGIVFWKDDEPQCKIKRSDFGLKWPVGDEVTNEIHS